MSGELPPANLELIPSLFTDHQHVHDPVLLFDIIPNAIVAKAKFPGRDWGTS
jgi:hypothetical protein